VCGNQSLIVRWHKDQNYFIVRLYQDLVGDWVITQCWGHSSCEDEGFVSHTVADSYEQACLLLEEIKRQQQRDGFARLPDREEQLPLNF